MKLFLIKKVLLSFVLLVTRMPKFFLTRRSLQSLLQELMQPHLKLPDPRLPLFFQLQPELPQPSASNHPLLLLRLLSMLLLCLEHLQDTHVVFLVLP